MHIYHFPTPIFLSELIFFLTNSSLGAKLNIVPLHWDPIREQLHRDWIRSRYWFFTIGVLVEVSPDYKENLYGHPLGD